MATYSKARIRLHAHEKTAIKTLLQNGKRSVRVVKRAQILLAVHEKWVVASIAAIVGVSAKTVYNTVRAYQENGLEYALYDLPRPGKSPALNEKQDSRIVALACSDPPPGCARWTVQLLVEAAKKLKIVMSISRETVRKLMETHALKPWREKMWCVAKLDEEYIKKMEDVLSVYEKAYDKRNPVICLDEKPVQLLSEPHDCIPARSHQVKRRDHEYKREGVANVFCAVEPKSGRAMVSPTQNRKAKAFAKFFRSVLGKYPHADKIHVVMDNLNTHRKKALVERYGEETGAALWERAEVHYTPKHASWLNQAEIALGIYSRQCLGRERIANLKVLNEKTDCWKNRGGRIMIDWRFTRRKARKKFKYKK